MPRVLRYGRANKGSRDEILACRGFVTPLRTVLGMGWGRRHGIGSLGLLCEVNEGGGCGQREDVKPGGGHWVVGSNEGGWTELQARAVDKGRDMSGGEQISPGSAGTTCGRV